MVWLLVHHEIELFDYIRIRQGKNQTKIIS